jgi:hypothetical protein
MITAIIALFVVYVIATAWAARQAMATREPFARQRAAMRFLIIASLGVPILVLLILVV